jgi:RHS repeat-associated protein
MYLILWCKREFHAFLHPLHGSVIVYGHGFILNTLGIDVLDNCSKVEGETETEIKYYYAASRRIAMRTDGTLNWLFSDHLSSTTIVTDESGTIVSEMKYTAFGEIRSENGVSPTDYTYTYTGQRFEVEFGLSYYVARWLDSYLNQFIQPDTIIPDPGNAADWNRYAYVNYNPVNFSDPVGMPTGVGMIMIPLSLTVLDFTRHSRVMFTRHDRPILTRHDRPILTRHDRPMFTRHDRPVFTTP